MDPEILAALQLVRTQSIRTIHVVEFLSAFARSPLRNKSGQRLPDLVAINAIATLVWPAAGSIFDAAAGHDLRNNLRQFTDAVVLRCLAHVERLVVNRCPWRFEHTEHRGHNVTDVDDRTPGGAVALDVDTARSHRGRD